MKTHKILYFDIETNAIDFWPTLEGLKDLHCISIYDPVAARCTRLAPTLTTWMKGWRC